MKDNQHSIREIPNLIEFSRSCLLLGLLSFGGSQLQLKRILSEWIIQHRYFAPGRLSRAYDYCLILPGPTSFQLVVYLGWLLHGIKGGLLSGFAYILPAFAVLSGIAYLYLLVSGQAWLTGLLFGLKPALIAVMAMLCLWLFRQVRQSMSGMFVALAVLLSLGVFHLPVPLVIIIAIALLYVIQIYPSRRSSPEAEKVSTTLLDLLAEMEAEDQPKNQMYAVGDESPVPPHAFICTRHTVGYLLIGICLWMLFMAILYAELLPLPASLGSIMPETAWQLSKAAVVALGGSYVMITYFLQADLFQQSWLTESQVMNGAALAEGLPGPFFTIFVYLVFLLAAEPLRAAQLPVSYQLCLAAAGIGIVFLVLPSFIFIFIGGPIIEARRRSLRIAALAKSVPALTLGVVASLLIHFSNRVFLIDFVKLQLDTVSFVFFAASIGLLVYKKPAPLVLLLSAVVGCCWQYSQNWI